MNNQTEISESISAVADKPKTVKLELPEEEADMIQTLLNDYALAYRSDRRVDYKPEPVPKEKVGQYPYVATPPAPEITNPAYDWINKKWYSKNTSDSLPVLANTVADVKDAQLANSQQGLSLTRAIKNMSESQNEFKKLVATMQTILFGIKEEKATSIESKTNQK